MTLLAKQNRPQHVDVLVEQDNGWVSVAMVAGTLWVEVYDQNDNMIHYFKQEWPTAKKRKFKVRASYQAMCETEIEANSEEEAYEIAKKLDGSVFDTHCDPDDWHIEDVIEVAR